MRGGELTDGIFLDLEDLSNEFLLRRLIRSALNVFENQRNLHDVLDGRDEEVSELELLAPRVLHAELLPKSTRGLEKWDKYILSSFTLASVKGKRGI